jgi:hypothetical protein
MQQLRLIRMCLNETYIKVWTGKHCLIHFLFSRLNKEVLNHHHFQLCLRICAIRKVQANHEEKKLDGTFQHLIYARDVNLLGKNINNNKEALLLASKAGSLIMVHIIHIFRGIYLFMVC